MPGLAVVTEVANAIIRIGIVIKSHSREEAICTVGRGTVDSARLGQRAWLAQCNPSPRHRGGACDSFVPVTRSLREAT